MPFSHPKLITLSSRKYTYTFISNLKKHPPNTLSKDIWQEIEMIFWRQKLTCLPTGSAIDGLIPHEIESTKRGIEIHGEIWFLTGGKGAPNSRYNLNLYLCRPRFSSIESLTTKKLNSSTITESYIENGLLNITIR